LLSKRYGRVIHTLSDLVTVFEEEFAKRAGFLVGVKIWLAYRRSIHFEKTTWDEAERVFNKIYSSQIFRRIDVGRLRLNVPEGLSFEEVKPLQDFMIHKLIQLAITHNLPIQIHTGLQEGNENVIHHSNPLNIISLIMEYKEAKFDLLHGGYPYTHELAVLVKNFPNVYIDMCWLHIISPTIARQVLSEWLDTVPSNKIMGFGGDYRFIEGVYGHMALARENITRVLAEKVKEDGYTEEQAAQLARKILRDTPITSFYPTGRIPKRI
jgi:hypothetical protein